MKGTGEWILSVQDGRREVDSTCPERGVIKTAEGYNSTTISAITVLQSLIPNTDLGLTVTVATERGPMLKQQFLQLVVSKGGGGGASV